MYDGYSAYQLIQWGTAVALALLIAWVSVPIILLNINAYVRRLWLEQKRTNELLESMRPGRREPTIPSVRIDPRE